MLLLGIHLESESNKHRRKKCFNQQQMLHKQTLPFLRRFYLQLPLFHGGWAQNKMFGRCSGAKANKTPISHHSLASMSLRAEIKISVALAGVLQLFSHHCLLPQHLFGFAAIPQTAPDSSPTFEMNFEMNFLLPALKALNSQGDLANQVERGQEWLWQSRFGDRSCSELRYHNNPWPGPLGRVLRLQFGFLWDGHCSGAEATCQVTVGTFVQGAQWAGAISYPVPS